jgi:hypothetical protein
MKSAQIGSLACQMQIDADPVPDPVYHFDADQDPIHADPDPDLQHSCNHAQTAFD